MKAAPGADLSVFAPRTERRYVVGVCVPTAGRLESKGTGVAVRPGSLSAGDHDVMLRVSEVPADAILSGNVEVRSITSPASSPSPAAR